MNTGIRLFRAVLSFVYAIYKLFPVKNKVTFISRQSNVPSMDVEMLINQMSAEIPDCKTVVLFKKIEGKAPYLFHMIFPQLFHIATSKVIVLDSYCIAISLLKHRPSLRVIQMWHALGAYKKFGKSILDKQEGTSSAVASAMQMHRGYDVILASSEYCKSFLGEAFGYPEEVFRVIPLPRTDRLRSKSYMASEREQIIAAYPKLSEKINILYAPTMRKTGDQTAEIERLISVIDYTKYNLILSLHPLVQNRIKPGNAIVPDGFTSMELLSVCDIFVTDYSAMIYEAAVMKKPIYLYAYDLDMFIKERGFYLDPQMELPVHPAKSVQELMEQIGNRICQPEAVADFSDKYIANNESCTKELVSLIRDLLYN